MVSCMVVNDLIFIFTNGIFAFGSDEPQKKRNHIMSRSCNCMILTNPVLHESRSGYVELQRIYSILTRAKWRDLVNVLALNWIRQLMIDVTNGKFNDTQYFECEEGKGSFVKLDHSQQSFPNQKWNSDNVQSVKFHAKNPPYAKNP
eukprot:819837_1